ncbi:MAG: hypothetical protein PHF51_04415 [Candidatus ainarchaeum sp.]|nr:hypothetical protein [Candidatus ainarchaeum sp.]
MNLKYWEWENAPTKERLKAPSVKDIARVFFDNETQAYRFACALTEVKRRGRLRLRDCPGTLPVATWKRYLDYGARAGILKHEENAYEFTDRFSTAVKNFASFFREWAEKGKPEDLESAFALAKKEKQKKRGGRPELGEI